MRIPATAPDPAESQRHMGPEVMLWLAAHGMSPLAPSYLHWDELSRRSPPQGLSREQWWAALSLQRLVSRRLTPLTDRDGAPFWYNLTDPILTQVAAIERTAAGRLESASPVLSEASRDRYVASSAIEEAIRSSQLEGAATTRRVASDMLREGRPPANRHERMIRNNHLGMLWIREHVHQPITPEGILTLHRVMTEGTLDEPELAGRLRTTDDVVVRDAEENVLHRPPPAAELPQRLARLCDFAQERSQETFLPGVVRAILLHLALASDHPFVDGNGRTARALFYWSMRSQGYWLFEYLSISRRLREAPARYARSFLLTEIDHGNATYFILEQLRVIDQATADLHAWLERKQGEDDALATQLAHHPGLNHRQRALLGHALRHGQPRYTIASHQRSHQVVYQTARTDLLDLEARGLLRHHKEGRALVFTPVGDLRERLRG